MPTTKILHQTHAGSELAQARLQLAQAVLKPDNRVWLLGADNERISDRPIDLAPAVTDGRPYMAGTHDQLLVADVDTSQKPRAAVGLRVVIAELRVLGIQPVVLNSGRPGHQHLFAQCGIHLQERLGALAKTYGIDVRTRSPIRLPLSPHRHGYPVSLVEPATVEEAVMALRRRVRRPLRTSRQSWLDTGVSPHESDSERLQALCLAMYQADWLPDEAYEVLRGKPGGKVLQRYERQGRDPRTEFRRSWEKARLFASQHPRFEGPQELGVQLVELQGRAEAHAWSGVAGSTQRMVLERLIEIAISTSQVEVSASERQLVEDTSRARRGSVRGALKALQRDGWIRRVTVGSVDKASTYRLNLGHACAQNDPLVDTPPITGVMNSGSFLAHDLFARAGGLGVSPARVYAVLVQSPGPLSMAKIVAATHLKPRTVQKALRALADTRRNLAVKTSDGWICGPADIDELAQHRGSTGKGAELKARHRAERLVFRGHEVGSRVYIVKAAPQRKQCTGTTQAGAPCRAWARHDSAFCVHHEPKPEPIVVASPMVVRDVAIEIPSQRQAGTEDRRQRHLVDGIRGPG